MTNPSEPIKPAPNAAPSGWTSPGDGPPKSGARKPWWRKPWGIAAIVIVILVALSAFGAAIGGGQTASTASPAPSQVVGDASQPPTATATSEATPPTDQATPSDVPTPTATEPPTQTAEPTAAIATFGDSDWVVGEEIASGTYRTREASPGCYWARLSGFSGELGEIIANENASGPTVVTIAAKDKGFTSNDCGTWTKDLSRITTSKTTVEGDGTFIVGTDISPGTYTTDGGEGCYWVVTIKSSDKGFQTNDSGSWTKR